MAQPRSVVYAPDALPPNRSTLNMRQGAMLSSTGRLWIGRRRLRRAFSPPCSSHTHLLRGCVGRDYRGGLRMPSK